MKTESKMEQGDGLEQLFAAMARSAAARSERETTPSPWSRPEILRMLTGSHGGAERLKQLTLSLWSGSDYPCDLGWVIGGLDTPGQEVAMTLMSWYARHGENDEVFLEYGRSVARRQQMNQGSN